jgi:hypothetical protein
LQVVVVVEAKLQGMSSVEVLLATMPTDVALVD